MTTGSGKHSKKRRSFTSEVVGLKLKTSLINQARVTKFAYRKSHLELSGFDVATDFQIEASIFDSLETALIQTILHGRICP
jgi:hypothetical protein